MSFNIETYKDYTIFWSMDEYCIVKDGVILATSDKNNRLGAPKEYIESMILKKEEYDRGYKVGFQDGYESAEAAAENFGQTVNYEQAFENGRTQGRNEALAEPHRGYGEGFAAGEVTGRAESEHKIADLIKKNKLLEYKIAQFTIEIPSFLEDIATPNFDYKIDVRPSNCRNRLKDEGKSHPKSGCQSCQNGGLMGCPHERTKYTVKGD